MYFLLCTWQLREKEMNAIVLTDSFVVSYEIVVVFSMALALLSVTTIQ